MWLLNSFANCVKACHENRKLNPQFSAVKYVFRAVESKLL